MRNGRVGSLALCCALQRDTESHRHSTPPRTLKALRTSESPLTGLSRGNFSWDGEEFTGGTESGARTPRATCMTWRAGVSFAWPSQPRGERGQGGPRPRRKTYPSSK